MSSTLSQQVRAVRALLTSMAASIADDLYGALSVPYIIIRTSMIFELSFFCCSRLAPRLHQTGAKAYIISFFKIETITRDVTSFILESRYGSCLFVRTSARPSVCLQRTGS